MDPSAATMMSTTATPAPDQAQSLALAPINNNNNNNGINIKSAARKLPIKRKIPPTPQTQTQNQPQPQPQTPLDHPVPIIINPLSLPLDPCPDPSLTASSLDNNNDDDDDDDNNESSRFSAIHSSNQYHQQQQPQPPPFKYVRVWSESDEIRFLQGLLGCASQGLVFPRDLNVFYDTFSESMPEPFTRTQLYEKLRRLRNKFHLLSARIDAGLDPDRLAPHDRDLLHLCTRLWHPKFASTSPFSLNPSTTSASPPPPGSNSQNERHRRRRRSGSSSITPTAAAAALPLPTPMVSEPVKEEGEGREETDKAMEMTMAHHVRPSEEMSLRKTDVEYAVAKAVLDVFEETLREMRATLARDDDGLSEGNVAGLERRWKELRVAELDVFARRLRLVLNQSLIAS